MLVWEALFSQCARRSKPWAGRLWIGPYFTSWHHFLGLCKLCRQILKGSCRQHMHNYCVRRERRALLRHTPYSAPLPGASQIIHKETQFVSLKGYFSTVKELSVYFCLQGACQTRKSCKSKMLHPESSQHIAGERRHLHRWQSAVQSSWLCSAAWPLSLKLTLNHQVFPGSSMQASI